MKIDKGCYDAVQYTIPSSIETKTSTIQQTSTLDYKETKDTLRWEQYSENKMLLLFPIELSIQIKTCN